jgi:hypothetical protein
MTAYSRMNNAIECYIHFCYSVNIDPEQTQKSLVKYILLHQRFINVRNVYNDLFPGEYVNWGIINTVNNMIQYTKGGVIHLHKHTHWLALLQAISLEGTLSPNDLTHPMFSDDLVTKCSQDFKSMSEVLKRKDITSEQTLCKLVLLKHILYDCKQLPQNHSSSSFIIEQLFEDYSIDEAMNKSLFFAANMTDVHLSTEDHENHIKLLLSRITIDEKGFHAQVAACIAAKRAVKEYVVQNRNNTTLCRPRLTDKLRQIQAERMTAATNNSAMSPTAILTETTVYASDNFEQWCRSVRFPNTFSYGMKCQIYFVMSQCHVEDTFTHIPRFIRCKFASNELRKSIISQPCIDVIFKTIQSCIFTGHPFQELIQFRKDCLCALRQTIIDSLTWNNVFHLYICVYQNPAIWNNLWKRFLSQMNVEIVKSVHTFVTTHAFCYEHVIHIFMKQNGVPFEHQVANNAPRLSLIPTTTPPKSIFSPRIPDALFDTATKHKHANTMDSFTESTNVASIEDIEAALLPYTSRSDSSESSSNETATSN